MAAATQDISYLYPSTWTNLTDTAANYASGFPQWTNDTYQNWYDQPLSTGETPGLTDAYGNMQNSDFQGQAAGALGQASQMYQQNGTYDPNQMQQFLNPYTQDANQATINASNRNLFENVLPQVNSTFTGAGQFGSSRNMDFNNRAIRDQQSMLTDSLAKSNSANFTNAQNQNLAWAQQGNASASGLGQVASQNAQLGQQDLTNQMTGATNQQQLQQTSLDKNYQDWITQQQFPISGLSAVSTAMGNMSKGVQPNQSTPVTQPDDVSRVLAAIQAVSSGLNDSSIQSVLGYLFPDGNFTLG